MISPAMPVLGDTYAFSISLCLKALSSEGCIFISRNSLMANPGAPGLHFSHLGNVPVKTRQAEAVANFYRKYGMSDIFVVTSGIVAGRLCTLAIPLGC
jgi:hypothetical protein